MIIFVIVTVIVAVWSYGYFMDKARKAAQEKAQLEEQRKAQEEQQARVLKQQQEIDAMMHTNKDASAKRAIIEQEIRANPLSFLYRSDTHKETAHYNLMELDPFLIIAPKKFVVFDLETTGLTAGLDHIVEIAAVRVYHGQIVETYHQLVNPGIPMPVEATSINHITDAMLADQPKIHQILPSFLDFVGNDVLAAHNAKFDATFITYDCLRYDFKYPKKYFDTRELSVFWPDSPDRKLITLLKAAGIAESQDHRAQSDAELLAQLISAALQKSTQTGGGTT